MALVGPHGLIDGRGVRFDNLGSTPADAIRDSLAAHLDEAEKKAWESLARYKFQMFGYWAAVWVHLNRVGRFGRPNPWKSLVKAARGTR